MGQCYHVTSTQSSYHGITQAGNLRRHSVIRLVCAAVEARLSVLENEHSINEHSIAIATALPIAQIRTGQGEDLGNSFIACEIYKVASLGQFGMNSTPHVAGWGGGELSIRLPATTRH